MKCFAFNKNLLRRLMLLISSPFRISILFQYLIVHFGQIQCFSKVLKTNFEIQCFQHCLGILLTIPNTYLPWNAILNELIENTPQKLF